MILQSEIRNANKEKYVSFANVSPYFSILLFQDTI